MKILVTGDDGYKALGLRLVAAILKNNRFDVKIAATKTERSATGGYVVGSGQWDKDEVEGVEVLWVNGAPADAVECAGEMYGTFDLIVSGMNLGPNVGATFSSGTIGAAMRGLNRRIAPQAIALSWDVPEVLWDQDSTSLPVADYMDHPGKAIRMLVGHALKNKLWGAQFLNCNIPKEAPSRIILCSPTYYHLRDYNQYTVELNKEDKSFKKTVSRIPKMTGENMTGDAVALSQGNITVVPWLSNLYLNKELLALEGTQIDI